MGGAIQGKPLPLSQVVSTFSGPAPGNPGNGFVNGSSGDARYSLPLGITTDGVSLFVADAWNNSIRKIDISTGTVTTLAGSGSLGATDGPGGSATFSRMLKNSRQ